MSTLVKICGNRSVAEAEEAVRLGADAIGVLVGPHRESQKHFVDDMTARTILASLPPHVMGVLVTTHRNADDIRALVEKAGALHVQCHSDISLEEFSRLKSLTSAQCIAVVPVSDATSIKIAQQYAAIADMLLLDTAHKGLSGGTGVAHDWSVSAQIIKSVSIPVLLAGGLNPDNVADAIHIAHPYAVDVRSGVCAPSGDKDTEKMQRFISTAHTI